MSQHLNSLHQHAHIPSVILLEGLNHYGDLPGNKSHKEKHEERIHIALVCATLLDATLVCAKYTNKHATLITSLQPDTSSVPVIDIFFTDSVWLMDSDDHSGGVTVADVAYPKQQTKTRIEFKQRSCDRKLILDKIFQILDYKNKPDISKRN